MRFRMLIGATMATAISLAAACDSVDSPSMSAKSVPNDVLAMDVGDPGGLHNDMVRAYAVRRPLAQPPTRAEFVKACVTASNEAFASEGLPPAVLASDVEKVLSMIHELQHAGVFDFWAKSGDPIAIIDYWEAKGIVSPADAAGVHLRLSCSAPDTQLTRKPTASRAVWVFDSVYQGSRELWTHRHTEKNLKDAGIGPNLLTKEETMFELDAIGTLFGWFLGGPAGGTFGGFLFSIAFLHIPPDGGGGWDCSDYCNMG